MPTPKLSASKRQPLTLAQLAAYDDILTDTLVDHVCGASFFLEKRRAILLHQG